MICFHPSVTKTHDGQYKPRVIVRRNGQDVQSFRLARIYRDKNDARNVARESAANACAALLYDLPGFPVHVR